MWRVENLTLGRSSTRALWGETRTPAQAGCSWVEDLIANAGTRTEGSAGSELPNRAAGFNTKMDAKMKAAVFRAGHAAPRLLEIEDVVRPPLKAGHVLLRVLACGVCRTDLHIVDGDLPMLRPELIPGHQIVGEVIEGADAQLPRGSRVGVSWMGGVDGDCLYCRRGLENLCDQPVFTGYTIDGGYAEYVLARRDFVYPLPNGLDAAHVAPLLCAGIIGFRSLRVAGVEHGERVGLFGFGSSASLTMAVLQAWHCEVYVSTRGESHRQLAASLGAIWVGTEKDKPPQELDRAITFAPSGEVVVRALASLRKAGVLAINAIHLDHMPAFDYDTLLWGERQIRSVANSTRADARDFLKVAQEIGIRPRVALFPLNDANAAIAAVRNETADGAVVIIP
jgi:propanol-preferring alcohol dehydrogenase